MADVLNPQVQDGVVSENFKVGAGAPAFSTNRSQANAVDFDSLLRANQLSHAKSMDLIREGILFAGLQQLVNANVSPVQAVSDQKMLSGNDLAQQLAQLLAALGAGQMSGKQGDNAPPMTGTQTPGK